MGFTESIVLNQTAIEEIELIDESSETDVVNAAFRGFIGKMLLGPIGLAAAGTATHNKRYFVGITFKDGSKSILELDGILYRLHLTANE